MRNFKRPLHAIREPFGKAGLTVAILALVFAMVGGAYAAGALSAKQKKEVEKIAHTEAKNAAVPGPNGATGATGPTGPAGPAGAAGKDGLNGKDGAVAANGKSVEVSGAAAACPNGGVSVQVAGEPATRKEICNGEDGETGFTETLPPDKTETGVWGGSVFEFGPIPISFEIPLSAPLDQAHTVLIPYADPAPSECENAEHAGPASIQNPEAAPGFLCVYVASIFEGVLGQIFSNGDGPGAGVAGAVVPLEAKPRTPASDEQEFADARGTWAVTAP